MGRGWDEMGWDGMGWDGMGQEMEMRIWMGMWMGIGIGMVMGLDWGQGWGWRLRWDGSPILEHSLNYVLERAHDGQLLTPTFASPDCASQLTHFQNTSGI